MQPRLIRLRDVPAYLGMDRNRFNAEIRPTLVEIPIGNQGVAFDRLDLDAWVEHHKSRNGRPALRRSVWDTKECQDSPYGAESGTSTKKLTDSEFMKVLDQAACKKQKDT